VNIIDVFSYEFCGDEQRMTFFFFCLACCRIQARKQAVELPVWGFRNKLVRFFLPSQGLVKPGNSLLRDTVEGQANK